MSETVNRLPRQDGRTVLVTGANTGLGFHNALDLAALGARVVLGCRDESRARGAVDRIRASIPEAELESLALDLSSLDAVRAAATEFRSRHDTLDVLINNAGIMMVPHTITVDGFESQMAVNYWGHFLLTMSLIDLMPDTSRSRVVTLASLAHRKGSRTIRFDDIHWSHGYDRTDAYRQSKLACLLFALELDRRLRAAGSQVVSVAAHPGISPTELGRSLNPIALAVMRYTVGPFFTHSPAQASLPTLVAATDAEIDGGDYLGPQGRGEVKGLPGPAEVDEAARDLEAARRLWQYSVDLTGADLDL